MHAQVNKILQGDCLERLKELDTDSVDCIVTDPPYGYSFMGKDWDKAVPSVEVWKECLRVLKPGAFAFIMSAPRQDVLSQMIVRVTEAGFDTDYTSIYWTYASGFPKAMNIGKAVDKRNGVEFPVNELIGGNDSMTGGNYTRKPAPPRTTDEAKALDGSYGGFQPKPAVEVIIVAMKPLSEKTFVDQALKNGKGITWLDDARIPTEEKLSTNFYPGEDAMGNNKGNPTEGVHQSVENTKGRFPANLLVSDDVLNDGTDRKTGNLRRVNSSHFGGAGASERNHDGDSGSYSRYFSLDAWAKTLPFLIVPKASKSEKNRGLEGFEERTGNATYGEYAGTSEHSANTINKTKNHHPTVKPLKLMAYLITLGSREGDTILDPFAGSCTTCVAAKELKRNYIGIEREGEYVKICEARLHAVQPTLI